MPFAVGHPLTPMFFGLPDVRGISASPLVRYRAYLKTLSPASGDFTLQDVPVTASPLLDLAAVRYVVLPRVQGQAPPPSLPDDADAPLVHADDGVAIYANRAAQPRVRILHQSVPVQGPEQAQTELAALAAGALHAGQTPLAAMALLEPSADGDLPPRLDGSPAGDDEMVRIRAQDDPDRLVMEARLKTVGLVVVADTYYPGWQARVDGQPVPIFPANLLFRAVVVPAGAHTIELRYAPPSFRWGVWLFSVALACTLLLAVPPRRRWFRQR